MVMANNTVVGVFATPQLAQKAVMDLKSGGLRDDQIGVLSRNDSGKVVGKQSDDGSDVAKGAAAGAAAGASVGALWGLGILAGALPGIGPAIAGGTLGVLLSSATAGAAAAGIAGALMGMGLTDAEAKFYEGEFGRGRTLVTVDAGSKADWARGVLIQHGGEVRTPEEART